ncbi:hypothetical protein CRENBAI_003331 [Crenichthys baileyi]|uniref:Secreted protein n=1 Tax=Crenichthys baileyi TaxID=28760 RepID=A0AAV9SMF0_9TELE
MSFTYFWVHARTAVMCVCVCVCVCVCLSPGCFEAQRVLVIRLRPGDFSRNNLGSSAGKGCNLGIGARPTNLELRMGSVPSQTLSCKILQGNQLCEEYTVLSQRNRPEQCVISDQNQGSGGWFWSEIRAETSRHSRTCSLIVLAHTLFTFSKYQDKKIHP